MEKLNKFLAQCGSINVDLRELRVLTSPQLKKVIETLHFPLNRHKKSLQIEHEFHNTIIMLFLKNERTNKTINGYNKQKHIHPMYK